MCLRSTEPPLLPNPCYHQCFLVCRGWYVLFCLLSFVFLSCGGAFFKISFCLGLALQALLKTLVCAVACAVFKCACKMSWVYPLIPNFFDFYNDSKHFTNACYFIITFFDNNVCTDFTLASSRLLKIFV